MLFPLPEEETATAMDVPWPQFHTTLYRGLLLSPPRMPSPCYLSRLSRLDVADARRFAALLKL